jgi:hypothetical protein
MVKRKSIILLVSGVILVAFAACNSHITSLESHLDDVSYDASIETLCADYEGIDFDIQDTFDVYAFEKVPENFNEFDIEPAGGNIDNWWGRHRPLFYNMPLSFAELVGREVYIEWWLARSYEEIYSVSVPVAFIQYFNISREDFTRASEDRRYLLESIGVSPGINSHFELYDIDLIFSFDNERINRHFLWENTPFAREFGMGMEIGNHRHLFYNMPAPFVELVGREVFFDWRDARSQWERENESIAVGFINYFNISQEDFTAANEVMREIWENEGFTTEYGSSFEVYPVDLIFSMDAEAIREFFRIQPPPQITTTYLPNASFDVLYTATFQAVSDTPITWSVVPPNLSTGFNTLPPGLRLDPITGTLSGVIPHMTWMGANPTFTFTIRAEDDFRYSTQQLSITASPLQYVPDPPPDEPSR